MDLTFKNSTDLAPIISYAAKSHALVEIIDERTVRVTAHTSLLAGKVPSEISLIEKTVSEKLEVARDLMIKLREREQTNSVSGRITTDLKSRDIQKQDSTVSIVQKRAELGGSSSAGPSTSLAHPEAKQLQDRVWASIFGSGESTPSTITEIRQALISEVQRRGLDPIKAAIAEEDLNQIEAAGLEPSAQAAALAESLARFHVYVHGFSPDLARAFDTVGLIKGAQIGKGGWGVVSRVTLDGEDKVIKEFMRGKRYPIKLDPAFADTADPKLLRTPEFTAAFLPSAAADKIIFPSHFVVEETWLQDPADPASIERKKFVVAKDEKAFRAWSKERLLEHKADPTYSLAITAHIQDFVEGVDAFDYLDSPANRTPQTAKAMALGLLDAIETMAEHGFVHGDLKLENAFFDPVTEKLKLIDTGSLAKVSKRVSERPNTLLDNKRGYTPVYSLPALEQKSTAQLGVEQDLFAVGALMLELSALCEGDGHAMLKLQRFQEVVTEIHALAKQGSITTREATAEIAYLIKQSFPITGTKLEKAATTAINEAFNSGGNWDDLAGRATYKTLIEQIKTSI